MIMGWKLIRLKLGPVGKELERWKERLDKEVVFE